MPAMRNSRQIKIGCFSDLHGQIPQSLGVEVDLAVVAGDICPEINSIGQMGWLIKYFVPWISQFPKAVFIAGNHDYLFYHTPHLIPCLPAHVEYLQDSLTHLHFENLDRPLRIFGTPWSLRYGKYVFMTDESGFAGKCEGWPNMDILVSHGPPYGFGDYVPRGEHTGSRILLRRIRELKPTAVFVGHIHPSRGIYQVDETVLINASMSDDMTVGLRLSHPPIIVNMIMDENGKLSLTS